MIHFSRLSRVSTTFSPLIELLTVIAVIGSLIAILIPVAGAVRKSSDNETGLERGIHEIPAVEERAVLYLEADGDLGVGLSRGACRSETRYYLDTHGERLLNEPSRREG